MPARTVLESAQLNVRFGLWALLAYLTLGLLLEGMHGLKVGWYLEFETRRLLWTLGHAHGVLLAVLNIGFGLMLELRHDPSARWQRVASACLLLSAVLLPGGFLLGGIYVFEGDPGPAVLLSPIGGVCLFVAVLLAALHYGTGQPARSEEEPPPG